MKPIKHKYGAQRTVRHGIKWDSKLEANCASVLEGMKARGDVLFYLRQVPFDLPGNLRHRIDFAVFTADHVYFVESKGRDLSEGKSRRRQCENLYSVDIHVVTKPEQLYKVLGLTR